MAPNAGTAVIYTLSSGDICIIFIAGQPQEDNLPFRRFNTRRAAYQLFYFVGVHSALHEVCKLNDFGLAGLIAAGLIRPPAWSQLLP